MSTKYLDWGYIIFIVGIVIVMIIKAWQWH